jgi:hypothetical protein
METNLTKKNEVAKVLKKEFWLLQKHKPLGLIKLTDKEQIRELRDWLLTIDAWFIIQIEGVENEKIWKNIVVSDKISDELMQWFDFLVCDDNISNIEKYLNLWIAPIISKDTHLTSILKQFNPVSNEGNSFFYENENKWSIFASIIKYMENYKFPFDNKNLVNNILEI